MRARIDISEVEADTKIRAKYLRALENEEWDLLPGLIYVKSFLKTYGEYLGLDTRLLLDEFRRRYERPSDHDLPLAGTARERDRARERSARRGRVGGAMRSPVTVIVIALVVIVAALWLIGNHHGKNAPGGSAITPGAGNSGKHHKSRHHHAGGSGATTNTGTGTGPGKTSTKPVVTARATLKIVPTATVWICVENQAGKPLIGPGDYTAGQTLPTVSGHALLVTLGNTGVTVTADGKPYPLSGTQVTSLRITPRGVTTSATAATCQG